MWTDYANAIGMGLVLAVLGFVLARVSLVVGERSIERRYGRVGIRKMMAERAKMEQLFEARRAKRVEEIRQMDADVKALFLKRQRLQRSLNEAKTASERLVRLIGEEVEGTPCYIGRIVNKYVGVGQAQQRGGIYVDRLWSQPQEMEVWVRTVGEARLEIERRYPPSFGFLLTRLNELGVQDSPKTDANVS